MTSQRRRLRGPVRVVLSQTGPPRSGIRDARRPGGGDGGLCGDEFELRPAGFLVAMVSEDESKLWTLGVVPQPWWRRPSWMALNGTSSSPPRCMLLWPLEDRF